MVGFIEKNDPNMGNEIEIQVKRPKVMPMFQAEIYTTSQNPSVCRVVIGREGTECRYQKGGVEDKVEFLDISDFEGRESVERWVVKRLPKIIAERKFERVEFDRNFSYEMAVTMEYLIEKYGVN